MGWVSFWLEGTLTYNFRLRKFTKERKKMISIVFKFMSIVTLEA